MAMQHCLADTSAKINETRVRIRIKPQVGVFAEADLPKESRFPVVSWNIQTCPLAEMQSASFHCSELLHVIPTKVGIRKADDKKGGEPSEDVIWNPGSAIRLISEESKQSDIALVNSKMTRLNVAVISSCRGRATENIALVPAIELTQAVTKGQEIVCLIDDDFYSKPTRTKKIVVTPRSKGVKRVRSDPQAVVA